MLTSSIHIGNNYYPPYDHQNYYQDNYDQMQGYAPPSFPKKSYSMSLPSGMSHLHSQPFQPESGFSGQYQKQNPNKKENSILIASGFDEDVSPYKIFRLFSLYGNVTKVKIMFKKRDTALIQYMDSYQAKLAKLYLNGCMFGSGQIKVNTSKSQYIIMPKKGANIDSEECMLAQDFSHSKEHRYKIAGSRNFQNIAPPSKVLHLSNLPKEIEEEKLHQLFSSVAGFEKIKFFEVGGKTMAHAEFDSISTAIEIIIAFHNYNIDGRYLKLSFSKNVPDQLTKE